MRPLILALFGVLAACTSAVTQTSGSGHPLEGTVWDVAAGRQIDPETLAQRLGAADFAILGEVHDNPVHHERQAWLVERIAPAGIAFEMVPEASEEGIAVFLEQGGARDEIGEAIGWERLGWPDWDLYAPIVTAAPEAYVAGGGVARAEIRQAMEADAAQAFGAGARAYGLDEALSDDVRAAVADEMVAAHCDALPRPAAVRMVEAQRLRDARFAHALRRAAAAGGGDAVLITGNGHARTDRGVPAYLAASSAEAVVRSLGQIEVDPGATSLADYASGGGLSYDYVWFSGSPEREDPCAAFR